MISSSVEVILWTIFGKPVYRAKLGKQLSIKYGKFQAGVLFPWMKGEGEKLA